MNIVVALFDRFTALDAVGPYEVLSHLPGARVTFVGAEARNYRADSGALAISADATFAATPAADLLLVPGGPGTRALLQDRPTLDWIRRVHATTTWTTSVCTGALLLAAAGVLEGLDATTHWRALELLGTLGARPVSRRVVPQGKIVTAAGVSAGIDMALWLAAQIAGEQIAKAIQLGIEYDPQPPFDAGSPAKAGPDLIRLVNEQIFPLTPAR